jgi:hypothetical protein
VPPAASLAGNATTGLRVLPGKYTVRLTKNGQVTEAPLEVAPDARLTWSDADRKARFDAGERIYDLFRDETALFRRISALRESVAEAGEGQGAPAAALDAFDAKLDALRKEIVATKEGGAITGEERIREHTDEIYGAIQSWEGPPAQYQLARIDALRAELADLDASFQKLLDGELPALNASLTASGRAALPVPPVPEIEDSDTSGRPPGPPGDPDAAFEAEPQVVGPPWGFRPYF